MGRRRPQPVSFFPSANVPMLGGVRSTQGRGNFPLEDSHLAAAAAKGDQDAFTILVERYRRYVYAIAYKTTLDEEDALDVTQKVFLRVAKKIGDFKGKGTFRGWLATIAAREAIDHLRRHSHREISMEPEKLANISDQRGNNSSEDPRTVLEASRRLRLVEGAIQHLSPQQRVIFVLRFREEMGPKEIAERLSLPATQVRSQLHRAIAKIREMVGPR
jgi:RNA polymerase sigma-70 factor (ECF subfamily)